MKNVCIFVQNNRTMAKKKVVEHEIVYKVLSREVLTKEMVDWLIAHGKSLNDSIKYHDPLLVQCVKELNPQGFGVTKIKGNKYKILDFPNDSMLVTPEDVKQLNKSWIVIEEPEEPEA